MNFKSSIIALMLLPAALPAAAAEMDHSKMDHSQMDHSQMNNTTEKKYKKPAGEKGKLRTLKKIPASGMAREAGYDGRYGMESTTVRNKLSTRCAQASRGLIILDNASWKRCGGKPEGLAKNKTAKATKGAAMDHSQHMNH